MNDLAFWAMNGREIFKATLYHAYFQRKTHQNGTLSPRSPREMSTKLLGFFSYDTVPIICYFVPLEPTTALFCCLMTSIYTITLCVFLQKKERRQPDFCC